MTVTVEYEAEEKLDLPYEEIIKNVIEESLDYVECPYDAEVNVLLTDNAGIHQINLDMRGIDNPTDVLSFPMCDFETPGDFSHLEETPEEYFDPDTGELLMGDIVISVDKVKEQAEKYGHSQTRELAFLVAHSMLHLSGYDHMEDEERIQMEDMQREILERRVTGDEKTGQSIYYWYWNHDGSGSAFRMRKESGGNSRDDGGGDRDARGDKNDRPRDRADDGGGDGTGRAGGTQRSRRKDPELPDR